MIIKKQKVLKEMSYIGIPKGEILPVASALNALLCSYHVYYQNLRSCHWNVKGKNFFQLHNEFEAIYSDARVRIDEIAERILTIGHQPISRMSEYLKASKIKEMEVNLSDEVMVVMLLKDQTKLISQMRDVIKEAGKISDEGTVDLLSGMIAATEKRTWMLGSWIRST